MEKDELFNRIAGISADVAGIVANRYESYGDPVAMYTEIARRWGCEPHEAALRMADLKLARLSREEVIEDSVLDAIAYLMFMLILDDVA